MPKCFLAIECSKLFECFTLQFFLKNWQLFNPWSQTYQVYELWLIVFRLVEMKTNLLFDNVDVLLGEPVGLVKVEAELFLPGPIL